MREIEFTMHELYRYYSEDFPEKLEDYYEIDTEAGYPRVIGLNPESNWGNPNWEQNGHFFFFPKEVLAAQESGKSEEEILAIMRELNEKGKDTETVTPKSVDETKANFMFSTLVYSIVCAQHTIHEMFGEEALHEFCICKDWPLFPLEKSSENILKDSYLAPVDDEIENFRRVLEGSCEIIYKELELLEFVVERRDKHYRALMKDYSGQGKEVAAKYAEKMYANISALKFD